ncbi:MAG: hypothetical protein LPK01_14930, partial [Hymenobacteraceae bacterium]|nr:hypothetical protein [Hymenobacteraceae bacterium]
MLLVNQADHNTIRNCVLNAKPGTNLSSDFFGILIGTTAFTGSPNNGSFNLIENNEINDGRGGIYMRNSGNATADIQNRVINNRINSPNSYGVYSRYQKQVYIKDNIIDLDGTSTGSYAVQSEYDDYFEITGNKILNFSSNGIYVTNGNVFTGSNTSRAKIVNNMIISAVSVNTTGIRIISNSNFIDIFHNSVSLTNGGTYAFSTFSSQNLNIRNNSFYMTGTTSSFNRLVDISASSNLSSFNYNNFYITGSSGTVLRMNNTDYTSTNFVGAGGYNQNSYYGDPGYLDPANDLHAITAQLNDKGDNSAGVTVDFDGNTRPATPGGQVDIGADEFTVFPQDISVAAITSPLLNGRVNTSKALKSNEAISIRLVNTGGQTLSNIPVFYSINGVTSAQETVPGPLLPGQSLIYTFSATANMAAVGNYSLSAYTAFATDNDRTNDTISGKVVRQLSNDPVVFPYFENFENTGSVSYNEEMVGLTGAEKFDFTTSAVEGRMRTFAGNGFANSGIKAITLDKNVGVYTIKPVNELILTANLSNYTTSDIILLDFAFAAHFNFMSNNDPGNRVWIRGNDSAPWIQVYDLFSNRSAAGVFRQVQGINLSNLLAANNQTYSSSFQIKFGQEGTGRASSNTCCGGFSFDDIGLRRLLQRDLGVTVIEAPAANSCGDSSQTVAVRVENFGINPQSNIPVTVMISGPVTTTLTGTIAGPLADGQSTVINLGNINTYAGGTFEFTAYTNFATDEDRDNDTLRSTVFINTVPAVPVAVNASGCEGEQINLSVTGNADGYNWYSSAAGGTALTTAPGFVTPALTATTTYYASAINFTQTSIGRQDNVVGSGGSVNLLNAGLQFDVFRELIVDTVFVYTASAGDVKVNLLNASGTVIATKTVTVSTPNVKTPVPVNFRVQPGLAYRLDAQGSTVTALFRNGTGNSFPYEIPNTLSITQGTSGSNFYYFFYDWKITIIECESNRIPVVATVNPNPVVNLGNDTINCTGGAVMLDAGNAGNGFTYLWSNGSTSQTIQASTSGMYTVTVTNPITGCSGTDQVNVTIGTPPT